MADGKGQAEPEGLQDFHLTKMASWREGGRKRAPPGAAGRWMTRRPAGRSGRGRRRRWATVRQEIDDHAWPGVKAGRRDASDLRDLAASRACAPLRITGGTSLLPPGVGLLGKDYPCMCVCDPKLFPVSDDCV